MTFSPHANSNEQKQLDAGCSVIIAAVKLCRLLIHLTKQRKRWPSCFQVTIRVGIATNKTQKGLQYSKYQLSGKAQMFG